VARHNDAVELPYQSVGLRLGNRARGNAGKQLQQDHSITKPHVITFHVAFADFTE
jgi:hypothetical protein